MPSRSPLARSDAVLWGSVGLALLALGFGVWQGSGRSFPLRVCFPDLPDGLSSRPLRWHGVVIGTVVQTVPSREGDPCAWAVLSVRNPYRRRIPVDSVVYLRADRSLELVALDPSAPPLRPGLALPGRPETAAPVERAWIERLQQTRDLFSGWIREFRRWTRSPSAPTDFQAVRQALGDGLRQRPVLGPCPSWTERRLAYLVTRQWADLQAALGLPTSDTDPVLQGLRRLWTDPTCDPTRAVRSPDRPVRAFRRGERP